MTGQELVERIAQERTGAYFQQWDTLTEGQRNGWREVGIELHEPKRTN